MLGSGGRATEGVENENANGIYSRLAFLMSRSGLMLLLPGPALLSSVSSVRFVTPSSSSGTGVAGGLLTSQEGSGRWVLPRYRPLSLVVVGAIAFWEAILFTVND